ncbi:MAG: hypothetical protein JZU47_07760 [Prolixibacteraceae bacterium]|nr:hypothetical protein [Prolixibacteraceae bacterium]
MGKVKQKSDGKGSLKDMQLLINEHPDLLNSNIRQNIPSLKNIQIGWLSPLKNDNYSEYKDDDFINLLGLNLTKPLSNFWPQKGPQWDALGKSKNGNVFLIEAKANIPEIVSGPTGARIKSKMLINKSLIETKIFLNINNDMDWSHKFYQYTNRLAHLYFLREQNNVPAWLVNIYFINDKTVNGPKTEEEWLGAIRVMKCYLGVGHHKLSKYMIDIFIDIEAFKD